MFIENLLECRNLFDIVALAYYEIQDDISAIKLDGYHEIDYQDIRKAIEIYIFSKEQRAFDFDGLLQQLQRLYEEKRFTFCAYYEIIRHIDRRLIDNMFTSICSNVIQQYKGLNTNCEAIGIYILPSYHKTIFQKYENKQKLLRSHRIICNEILELHKLIILNKELSKNYDISLYRMRFQNDFLKKVDKKKQIDFCLIPFSNERYDRWVTPQYTEKTFWFEQKENAAFTERFFESLDKALDTNAEIIIFPELVFTKEIAEKMKLFLRQKKCNDIKLIVAGSLSENKENICYVYDMRGNLLLRQYKQTPFYIDGHFESLKIHKHLSLLDIPGLGRIAFFICKDMINYDLFELIGILQVDIVILPAFSKSLDLKSVAEQASREFNCITIMINCCSSYNESGIEKDKKIGYVTLPAINEGERVFHTMYYCQDDKCENCDLCKMIYLRISTDKMIEINKNKSNEQVYCLKTVL